MRGQPFLQLLLVVVAFVAMGWPVLRLTRPAVANVPADLPPAAEGQAEVGLTLTVACVPAPEEVHLQSLGRDVLVGQGPQAEWTGTWKTRLPAEGVDLALRVRWPDANAPAAARVVVRFPDERPPLERTFWAQNGGLTELVTIPGAAP